MKEDLHLGEVDRFGRYGGSYPVHGLSVLHPEEVLADGRRQRHLAQEFALHQRLYHHGDWIGA
jgi:hypothetical protein